jgi:hypothetical protein
MTKLQTRVMIFFSLGLLLALGSCSDSSKREVTRITGETIRSACGNWDRCTVKCEKPDPYTGACPAVTTTNGSKDE